MSIEYFTIEQFPDRVSISVKNHVRRAGIMVPTASLDILLDVKKPVTFSQKGPTLQIVDPTTDQTLLTVTLELSSVVGNVISLPFSTYVWKTVDHR